MKTKNTSVQTEQTNDLNESLVPNHQGKDGKTPLKSKLVLIMFLGILVFGSLVYFLPMFLGNNNGLKAALTTENGIDTFDSAVVMEKGLTVKQTLSVQGTTTMNNLALSGAMKLGKFASDCTLDAVGVIQYNFATKNLEFCDGSTWNTIVTSNNNIANISISPSRSEGMNVTGTNERKEVIFTITNNGAVAPTGTLTTKLEEINFEITKDNCNGTILSPGGTCTVTVKPKIILDAETLTLDSEYSSEYFGNLIISYPSEESGVISSVTAILLGKAYSLSGCYTDTTNEAIIDMTNKLIWQKNQILDDYFKADSYCAAINKKIYVPTVDEFKLSQTCLGKDYGTYITSTSDSKNNSHWNYFAFYIKEDKYAQSDKTESSDLLKCVKRTK